jgi:HNH endonuclease
LRDRRCVISGEKAVGAYRDNWTGFEAAHIFPLAYEGYWNGHGYNRWVTIQPESGGTINSVQNGILLNSAIHQLFDSYELSVNPDVWIRCVLIEDIATNDYLRIITRSCSLPMMGKVLLESI